jgi:glucose-1-phosphate cytidylyltransferase
MKAVILCGGKGTRMREETEFRPKPMVEVGGRPIIWHIMKIYAEFGIRDFVLCLGYRGSLIKEYFLNYKAMNSDFTLSLGRNKPIEYHDAHTEQDFVVTLADTGQDAMTGARLKRVQRYVGNEPFLMTYGDGLADIDLAATLAFHRSHGRLATVTAVRPPSRFGLLDINAEDRVQNFAEKPQLEGWASAGFFVFNPGIFEYLSDRDECVLETEPLSRLAQDGQLCAYRHTGFYYAMDTYREYLILNEMWASQQAPWKKWT